MTVVLEIPVMYIGKLVKTLRLGYVWHTVQRRLRLLYDLLVSSAGNSEKMGYHKW
jgi:hypothetical protein